MDLFWTLTLVLHLCLFTLCICLAKCLKNYAANQVEVETGTINDRVSDRLRANYYICCDKTLQICRFLDHKVTTAAITNPGRISNDSGTSRN